MILYLCLSFVVLSVNKVNVSSVSVGGESHCCVAINTVWTSNPRMENYWCLPVYSFSFRAALLHLLPFTDVKRLVEIDQKLCICHRSLFCWAAYGLVYHLTLYACAVANSISICSYFCAQIGTRNVLKCYFVSRANMGNPNFCFLVSEKGCSPVYIFSRSAEPVLLIIIA
jgi:hypothetical protein